MHMKRSLLTIFAIIPLSLSAQNLYFSGGYILDRPTIKDGLRENGFVSEVNGTTQIDKIKQSGFSIGVGTVLKTKKTSTFGLRIEAAYEMLQLTLDRTLTTQQTLFTPQTTFSSQETANNSYLRLTPSISYCKLQRGKKSYQADLGFSQLVHLAGWKENSSFTAVHVSAGYGYGGILLKAGGEIGLSNSMGGEGKAYNVLSKRFFAGVTVYPHLLKRKKSEGLGGHDNYKF